MASVVPNMSVSREKVSSRSRESISLSNNHYIKGHVYGTTKYRREKENVRVNESCRQKGERSKQGHTNNKATQYTQGSRFSKGK